MNKLLPPNATPLEVRTATALAAVDALPIPIRDYWNPDKCPAPLLPYLAAEVSVDGWELAESDDARRALIKSAIALHQKRGTPWAIREVIRRLGFGEVALVEGVAFAGATAQRRATAITCTAIRPPGLNTS